MDLRTPDSGWSSPNVMRVVGDIGHIQHKRGGNRALDTEVPVLIPGRPVAFGGIAISDGAALRILRGKSGVQRRVEKRRLLVCRHPAIPIVGGTNPAVQTVK